MTYQMVEDYNLKILKSENYNYIFDKHTGSFMRWGKTKADDPPYSKFGPEIVDIEISEVCTHGCSFCYKSNVKAGKNMSLDTYKQVLDKLPKTVTQIAFGIGDIDGNPDLFPILEETRKASIIPNITIHGRGLTDQYAKQFVNVLGGIAVSWYNKDVALEAIFKLKKAGMNIVNIHYMLSEETYQGALDLLELYKTDSILQKVTAIVFLSLKQKGRGIGFTPLSEDKFKNLLEYVNIVPMGFDSCTAGKFMRNVSNPEKYEQYIEPCESTRFSLYINVDAKVYPCSFAEQGEGIDIIGAKSFIDNVWNAPQTVRFRNKCIKCSPNCPLEFKI